MWSWIQDNNVNLTTNKGNLTLEHRGEAQQAEITISPPLSAGEVTLMYIVQFWNSTSSQLKAINSRGLNKSLLKLSRAVCTWLVQSAWGFQYYLAWWRGRLCHYKGSGTKPFLVVSDNKTRINGLSDSGLAWGKCSSLERQTSSGTGCTDRLWILHWSFLRFN